MALGTIPRFSGIISLMISACILYGGLPACTQAAIVYKVIDLGALEGGYSEAHSINDTGQIVGAASSSEQILHATIFDSTGAGNNIDMGTLGGNESMALAINDAGQIIGWSQNAQGWQHATLFDPTSDGNNVDLGTLGGLVSMALAINNSGQIAGLAHDKQGLMRASLFDSTGDGNNINLGILAGNESIAFAINDTGQIIGCSQNAQRWQRATLFDPTGDGNHLDLGTVGGLASLALAINNSGQIVGWAGDKQNPINATLFDSTGDGYNINFSPYDSFITKALAINDAGQIVGSSQIDFTFSFHATLFDPTSDGNNIDLNTLIDPNSGWTLTHATDINNNGWIVGHGINPQNEQHAFLLVPISTKYSGGTGEPKEPYQIATAEDLILLGESPEDYDKHFILTADIDLNPNLPGRKVFVKAVLGGEDWPGFTGVFDGDGHKISHLTIKGVGYLGLFGQSNSEAAISNLGLEDVNVNGNSDYVGGLVGSNGYSCTITNCYVQGGSVMGGSKVGGLVGYNIHGPITDCYSSVSVSGDNSGGLVGRNSGTVTNCYATGSVFGDNCGGLVGQNDGVVRNSFWDTQTSGQAISDGGIGKTTVEMQDPNMFIDAGWDFVGEHDGPHDIWAEPADGGYLILWWQLSPPPPLPTFSGGTGESNDPYLVSTANELNFIGCNPRLMSAHFKLTNDIDLTWIDFNIIGSQSYPFTGVFNGDGHTISNFSYIDTHANNIGLFGYVKGENAVIKDLGLIAPETSGKHAIGSLIGKLNYGILSGCYTEGGSVTSDWSGGGLVGGNNYGTITNCYSTSNVFGSGVNYWQGVGGLLGYNSYGSITNCYTEVGNVSGRSDVGGLVGTNSGNISNCYSTVSVTGSHHYAGGLVGTSFWGSISDCYSTGNVVGYDHVGGLVGFNEFGAIITNCYATGYVSSNQSVGGLVGLGGSVYSSYWDTQTSGLSTSSGGIGKTTDEMQMANTFIGWAHNPVWTIDEGKDYPRLWWENMPGKTITTASPFENVAGSGTEMDPYLIYTAEELNMIRQFPYEWDKHFKLMSDTDLSIYTGESFEIIGRYGWPFTGVFDGNGHTISNFTYTSTSWIYIGFFGCVKEGTIKNLGLIYPNIVDGSIYDIGALVGYLQMGIIKNCYAKSGNIAGQEHVGGLVGLNSSGTITSSYTTSSVTGNIETGGLVGENSSGTIMNCYTNGIVSGAWCIGGLVGINSSGTITNSYAASSVSGDYWSVSGLVGENSGSITSSFWNIETIEQITSEGGIGLTTAEMQMAGTFIEAGWDFVDEIANGTEDIWWINEGQDYPKLWWQLGELFVFSPNPRNGIKELIQPIILSWKAVESTFSHDVYLGQDAKAVTLATTWSSGVYRGRLPAQETAYEPGRLQFATTYYWRIDEVNETDPGKPCKGDIWSFTTAAPVSHPDPADNGTSNINSTVLSWVPGSTVLHYDVYFGEDEEVVDNATPESVDVYVGRQTSEKTTFEPDNLKVNKTYYWRVDAVDPNNPSNIWKGNVWMFTTYDRSRIIID